LVVSYFCLAQCDQVQQIDTVGECVLGALCTGKECRLPLLRDKLIRDHATSLKLSSTTGALHLSHKPQYACKVFRLDMARHAMAQRLRQIYVMAGRIPTCLSHVRQKPQQRLFTRIYAIGHTQQVKSKF